MVPYFIILFAAEHQWISNKSSFLSFEKMCHIMLISFGYVTHHAINHLACAMDQPKHYLRESEL